MIFHTLRTVSWPWLCFFCQQFIYDYVWIMTLYTTRDHTRVSCKSCQVEQRWQSRKLCIGEGSGLKNFRLPWNRLFRKSNQFLTKLLRFLYLIYFLTWLCSSDFNWFAFFKVKMTLVWAACKQLSTANRAQNLHTMNTNICPWYF